MYPGRISKPPPGICRWCGIVIIGPTGAPNRRKTFCGPICVTHHLLRSDPSCMRRHVFYRDRGKCAACGFEHKILNGDWELDHRLPLMISLGDPTFWEPENCQILCESPCHKEKSASDRRKYRKRERRWMKKKYDDLSSME